MAGLAYLDLHWENDHYYHKTGAMLGDYYRQGAQLNLFDDNAPKENSEALMKLLDGMNHRYGRGMLKFAGQEHEQPWQMNKAMLSTAYTTRISGIPIVSAR